MITLYVGKSAAGKDTLAKRDAKLGKTLLVSYTTRPPREGEVDGVDYHFVNQQKFKKLYDEGIIIEHRVYHTKVDGVEDTWYYGLPRIEHNKDYVGVVTIDAAISVINIYGKDNIYVVYVTADDEVRRERAKNRGSFSSTEWERRLEADASDFSESKIKELEKALGHCVERVDNNETLTFMDSRKKGFLSFLKK